MISQNILTIDISNIDFNSTKFRMVGSLTLDKVKIKYNWIFNAQIKDAIIGENQNGLVWYSGTWISGTWEYGTWYSGTFLDGRWKGGDVYSYDIDMKQLLNGNFYIIRTDISKTHFVKCSFESGNFNYGIFGNVIINNNEKIPYEINKDFILDNIEDNIIDNGFNVGSKIGFYLSDVETYNVKKIISDKNDRILVGGFFTKYNGIKVSGLLRLNYDGTLENTFNGGFFKKMSGILINGSVSNIIIDSNNRIIVCGDFNYYNKTKCYNIIRIMEDGSIDETFNLSLSDGDSIDKINDIYVDSNNRIYLGGLFYFEKNVNGVLYKYKNLVKLNEDGSLNIGFGYKLQNDDKKWGFELNEEVNVLKYMIVNTFSRLLIGGDFRFSYTQNKVYDKLFRITLDGEIDDTYLLNCNNVTFYGQTIKTIDVDSKNRIYVGGDFLSYSYDYSYSGETSITYESLYSGIVRIKEDGTIDISSGEFISTGGFNIENNNCVNSIVVNSDDNIIVGGYFNNYNTDNYYNIVKILTTGESDKTFDVGYGTFNLDETNYNGSVNNLFVDKYGKIYLGGMFNIYDETENNNLILRLKNDGKLDINNSKLFLNNKYNKSVFSGGNFYNGLFTSSIFKSGNFYNGYFNNSIWYDGTWYNGEFLSGEWHNGQFLGGNFSNGNWYNGEFSELKNTIKSNFGLNFKNKNGGAANWYNGVFSNGSFYSLYHKELDETEKLNYSTDILDITDNTIVNWYNGVFNNGNFYSGTIHNCEWNNGLMYDSIILNDDSGFKFNNGHIYDTYCYGGVFKGGSISGGIYKNILSENTHFGYDIE